MANKGQKFTKYSYETKLHAVQEYLNGDTVQGVLEKYHIKNDSQLEEWIRNFKKGGKEALKPKLKGRKPKGNMQAELETLRMENDILKKIKELLGQKPR